MRISQFPLAAALAASALLAGCNKPETITANNTVDPTAEAVAAAPKVVLPPSVQSSKVYRCKDSSIAYVDFMSDGLTANFRADKSELTPVVLTAPAAGKPFVAEGYVLTGTGSAVTLTRPGKPEQSCKA